MRKDILGGCALTLLIAAATSGMATAEPNPAIKPVKGILPSGLGDEVDRDIARARAATARFRNVEAAEAAGYPSTTHCIENQPTGGVSKTWNFPSERKHVAAQAPRERRNPTTEDSSFRRAITTRCNK